MSYPDVASATFFDDLLSRKELFSLKVDPARNFRDPVDGIHDILHGKYLKAHSHQLFVRNFMNPNTRYKRLHLMHGCHGAGTPILMYDGTVRAVEDIAAGEQIMGDDSTPRNVLELAHGCETMYRVATEDGSSFTCNRSHIITIRHSVKVARQFLRPMIEDISIRDFFCLPKAVQCRARMITTSIDFAESALECDAYAMGFWINSGRFDQVALPREFIANSRENRLRLLAGILDASGDYSHLRNRFHVVAEQSLATDIVFVAKSLGLQARMTISHGSTNVIISGEGVGEIPTMFTQVISSDRAPVRRLHRFSLREIGRGHYYGFAIDGNGRYVLGNFVVTHNTGTGKTLAAVSIAQEFIKVYAKMYAMVVAKTQAGRRHYAELDRATPSVFVLGFGGTKAAFVRELLRYPEFGFISLSEKEELLKRRKIAEAGLPDDIKNYREYYSYLKKRITNKGRGGFYKFYGYDEFVNRLFLSDNVKLTDLEALATQKLRAGEDITLEDIVAEHIREGKIQVNHQLLAMFENSLIIADEVHNTYNMNMKNNRGVVLQYILDTVPSVRFLSLSATPINNSPTESVELINYLVDKDSKITKKSLFTNPRTLAPGKLELIGHLTRGKISFLQDSNVKYYPAKVWLGEPIVLPTTVESLAAGSTVPYLKFIQCPMSELHQSTYVAHLTAATAKNNTDGETVDPLGNLVGDIDTTSTTSTATTDDAAATADPAEVIDVDAADVNEGIAFGAPRYAYHSIPTDGYSIYDIVFPSPESSTVGVFRSSEVRSKISMAPQEWRDQHKISVKKYSAINNVITGDFLHAENVGQYSAKYRMLLSVLTEIIASAGGDPSKCQKTMIYHDRVKTSGTLLIQELLRVNGYLDEYSEPIDSTLCVICGVTLAEHGKVVHAHPHDYRPARFVMAHSDVDKATMDQSLAKYDAADNIHGHQHMMLVGSKIIKESFDLKGNQHIIFMSLPTNIPTFIQVLGRCIRKNSHIDLPPEQRRVNIRILISVINPLYPAPDPISPELYRYIDKLLDYMVIQNIEREFNRNAIDAAIHRDIVMSEDLRREYFPDGREGREGRAGPIDRLGNLYFESAYSLPSYTLGDLNLATFNAYKYYEEEIRLISYIIKRLFILQPVWTYDDLWAAVRAPPIGVEVNPGLFLENNFIIALNNLIRESPSIVSVTRSRVEMNLAILAERLFDIADRYIYIESQRYKIEQIGVYYTLFPIADIPINPLNAIHAEYTENFRDRERVMIKELRAPSDRVVVDVETYQRRMPRRAGVRINLDAFVRESKADINYVTKKAQFVDRYKGYDDISGFLTDFSAQFQMSFVEEAVTYSMLGAAAFPGVSEDVFKLYAAVIKLFDQFRVIVYAREVAKYKDTAKQYKVGLPALSPDTPLGYMSAKSVRLFDPQIELGAKTKISADTVERGKWIEVSKIALNRHMAYKENDIIVGYFQSVEDHMLFKLRKPIHRIKEDIARETRSRQMTEIKSASGARTTVNDTRLIEKGIVCASKTKRDLLQILASLGVSVSKMERGEIRIRKLCLAIKRKIMCLEIKERQKDSRYKYLYSWWDEAVDIARQL
jgi:hypothetical protein